jgi:tetratricopeptide (TPR) repeat protein
VLQHKGELDAAEQAYRSAIAMGEDLAGEFPNVPAYKCNLADSRESLGTVLQHKGELDEAEQAYRLALALREELVFEFPQPPARHRKRLTATLWRFNNLAWRIAASPEVNLRDAASAVELARKAAQGVPENAAFWNTHYRAGQWEDTITAAGKARELGASGHEGMDLFFIAMAHWQLGKEDEACQWYDRAVEWMEQHEGSTNQKDNRLYRAEAADLLGIPQPTGGREVAAANNE